MTTTTAFSTTNTQVSDLAEAIASDGAAAHEGRIRSFVASLRPSARSTVAVEVLLDRQAAPIVRARAFGVVSATVAAADAPTLTSVHDLAA